jgi:hypothetical protein
MTCPISVTLWICGTVLKRAGRRPRSTGSIQYTGVSERAEGALAVRTISSPKLSPIPMGNPGEPRGTEGSCHQFCDQIEGN